MKVLFSVLISLVMFSSVGIAGNRQTSELSFDSLRDYDRIEIDAPYDVYITQTGGTGVRVECDERIEQYIDVTVKGRTLYIGVKDISLKTLERYVNRNGYTLAAYASVGELESLKAGSVSKVYVKDCIVADDLDMDISGVSEVDGRIKGGNLNLDLSGVSRFMCRIDFDHVDVRISGASKCELEGKAECISADVSGASSMDAESFECKDATVNVSGASKAEVRPSETISFYVSGVSSLKYPEGVKIEGMSVSGVSSVQTFQW